ncbi:SRPBCC domain-containing protein [Gymnodinialimonas hymeniacidonis]|uniref:SRPBCC domain-containing protein n=1 Tax=Gymnodinialimonas hymeniacidonis TaxID=3126508 RepID=UPI0034C5C80C
MTTDTDTFHFTRAMPLSADRMWHLITDTTMRESWGAPGDHVLETITADMRVGGVERHRCGPADNPEFEVETRWLHLDAPGNAVFTEQIEAGGMTVGASLVTFRIAEADAGSTVTATVAVSSFVGPEMIAEFKAGWEGGLVNLEKLAKSEAESA